MSANTAHAHVQIETAHTNPRDREWKRKRGLGNGGERNRHSSCSQWLRGYVARLHVFYMRSTFRSVTYSQTSPNSSNQEIAWGGRPNAKGCLSSLSIVWKGIMSALCRDKHVIMINDRFYQEPLQSSIGEKRASVTKQNVCRSFNKSEHPLNNIGQRELWQWCNFNWLWPPTQL